MQSLRKEMAELKSQIVEYIERDKQRFIEREESLRDELRESKVLIADMKKRLQRAKDCLKSE